MHRSPDPLAIALVCLLAAAPAAATQEAAAQEAAARQAAPAAPTVEEIVARNLEARGGEEKLQAVTSARVTGTMAIPPGVEAPFVWEWKAPDKVRMEFTAEGMTAVQAFDGEVAWMVMPFTGSAAPQRMGEDEREMIEDQADFAGPLVDSEAKGYTISLAGPAEVDGAPAWELEVADADGDATRLFLDRATGLEVRAESTRTIEGRDVEIVTSIGDYETVGDVVLAHSYEIRPRGVPQGQTITFETVELGVELDDARFAMPGAAGAEEAGPRAP